MLRRSGVPGDRPGQRAALRAAAGDQHPDAHQHADANADTHRHAGPSANVGAHLGLIGDGGSAGRCAPCDVAAPGRRPLPERALAPRAACPCRRWGGPAGPRRRDWRGGCDHAGMTDEYEPARSTTPTATSGSTTPSASCATGRPRPWRWSRCGAAARSRMRPTSCPLAGGAGPRPPGAQATRGGPVGRLGVRLVQPRRARLAAVVPSANARTSARRIR